MDFIHYRFSLAESWLCSFIIPPVNVVDLFLTQIANILYMTRSSVILQFPHSVFEPLLCSACIIASDHCLGTFSSSHTFLMKITCYNLINMLNMQQKILPVIEIIESLWYCNEISLNACERSTRCSWIA